MLRDSVCFVGSALYYCTAAALMFDKKEVESSDMKMNCNKKRQKRRRKAEGVTGTMVWNGKGFSKNSRKEWKIFLDRPCFLCIIDHHGGGGGRDDDNDCSSLVWASLVNDYTVFPTDAVSHCIPTPRRTIHDHVINDRPPKMKNNNIMIGRGGHHRPSITRGNISSLTLL
mmetsp:Transcript_21187/g.50368  ORF Transcript_21187/g.50368 Transcript_21187/m.50368 type:complete len:170 (-) Transcript_21187:14-523(-)